MKWMALAFPLIILMDLLVFINFFQWHQQSIYEFEQRQLDLQVNYAISAAAQEMLENSTHIGTDYIDWGTMDIEPELALDTYLAVLLRNFGWADTPQNRMDLIETAVPVFVVAGYDGYYVYGIERDYEYVYDKDGDVVVRDGDKVKQNTYRHVWTPKLPYSETVKDSQYGYEGYTTYFYNLGYQYYGTHTYRVDTVADDGVNKGANVLKYDNPLDTVNLSGYNTKSEARNIVAKVLTDACNNALFLGLEGKVQNEWYIPSSFSEWSRNRSIDAPSILTYVTRNDNVSIYDVATFGIGGAKIDEAEFCICYVRDGVKLYTHASNRSAVENGDANYAPVSISAVVASPTEAAEKGYFYDTRFVEVTE